MAIRVKTGAMIMFFLTRRRPKDLKVLLIGPSNAGKTSLLGALPLAAELSIYGDSVDCVINAFNKEMKTITAAARQSITSGRLPVNATTAVTEYSFELEARNDGFCTLIVEGDYRRVIFSVLDGPGGILLPRPDADGAHAQFDPTFRKVLLERAAVSQALVLCMDATDYRQTTTFFISFAEVLQELGEPLRYENVVVLLTKADRYFSNRGRDAEQAATQTNPWFHAWQLLSKPMIRMLWDYCDPKRTELASAWVSVFGFTPREGFANYDFQTGGLRSFRPGAAWSWSDIAANWRPFQILDPLIYLAGGGTRSLWIHRNYRIR